MSVVMKILNEIEAEKSRLGKIELIKANAEIKSFVTALTYAYDPFTTFGVTVSDDVVGTGRAEFEFSDALIIPTLDDMAQRKTTGGAAQAAIEDMKRLLSPESFEVVRRIITKDLRCGISIKTINVAIPNLIPVFSVMLAHKFEEMRMKTWPVIVEPKLDGVRVLCVAQHDGRISFLSRTGKPFPAIGHLANDVEVMIQNLRTQLRDTKWEKAILDEHGRMGVVLDGEIIAGSFNKTSGDIRRKSAAATDAEYHLFDVISLTEFMSPGPASPMYMERRNLLEKLHTFSESSAIKIVPRYFAHSVEDIRSLYDAFQARGLEGAMVKNPAGAYAKSRSHGWLKLKSEETLDLIVVDAFEGTGQFKGQLGGLVVDMSNGVHVRVGGGFSATEREELWKNFTLERDGGVPDERVLGRMIEVRYHEETPDGSLRHPRFVRFRDDKQEAAE